MQRFPFPVSEQFTELLVEHIHHVHGYLFALVGNWADADDLLQETGLALWRDFNRFQSGTDFRAWARTIARFRVLAFRKRLQQRHIVSLANDVLEKVTATVEDEAPYLTDCRDALTECVRRLPVQARTLLELAYRDRRPLADVAREVGKTPQATRKALSRLRAALRECIDRRLGGPIGREQPPSARGGDDLFDLTTALSTASASASEADRLNRLLRGDPGDRQRYVRHMYELTALRLVFEGLRGDGDKSPLDPRGSERSDEVYALLPPEAWPPGSNSDRATEAAPSSSRQHRKSRSTRGRSRLLRWPLATATGMGLAAAVLLAMLMWPFSNFSGHWSEPVVAAVSGEVMLEPADGAARQIRVGAVLHRGERLRTGRRGTALLRFDNGTRVTLTGETDLASTEPTAKGERWHLHGGLIEAEVHRAAREGPLTVTTAVGSAVVVGTRFRLQTDGRASRLQVNEGTVHFADLKGNQVLVRAGEQATGNDQTAPVVSPSSLENGAGLKAEYFFDSEGPDIPKRTPDLIRTDPAIDFCWMDSNKMAIGQQMDQLQGGRFENFIIRWTGRLRPRFSETYTLSTVADDDVRVWVDDKLIINGRYGGSIEKAYHSAQVPLTVGRAHRLRVEYVQGGGAAYVNLKWSSRSQPEEVIPSSQLWPP